MENFICKHCNKSFDNYQSFRKHLSLQHKIKSEETYIKYKCNGIRPTCECGCGKETKYLGDNAGFRKFISGHNSATSANNFHLHPESKIKSAKTQSENWKKGMYRKWWEEDTEETRNKIEGIKEKLKNNKERGDKISKSLTGVPKTEEQKRKSSETNKKRFQENPELITKCRERRVKWLKRKLKQSTKLEKRFMTLLGIIGLKENVNYEFQYEYKHRIFDFYLYKEDILIEVDGDFYHCNPNSKHTIPLYETQKITLKNDEYKNNLCAENNKILYRFWEKDINERPEWVISEIKKLLL